METTQTEAPNFQTVWAALMETDRIVKDIAKRQKETAPQMKETDRQIKEFNQRFGEFTNRFGEIVEYMIAPKLADKFSEIGVFFEKAHQNTKIRDKKSKTTIAEADITLENGEKVMLVEVKSKLTTEDIKEHIERMNIVRSFEDEHKDKRKLLGAVAAVVMTDNVRNFALKSGFYVIEPSGETFTITEPKGIYSLREW
jgi:hypothetical protein